MVFPFATNNSAFICSSSSSVVMSSSCCYSVSSAAKSVVLDIRKLAKTFCPDDLFWCFSKDRARHSVQFSAKS